VLGGSPYGLSNAPALPGSGGGTYVLTSGQDGGYGGGVLWVYASGVVTIEGDVTADGEVAGAAAGGGSGGSIFIATEGSFSGTLGSKLWAEGGDGSKSAGTFYGGGGGGGRIAIWYGVPATARDRILAGTFAEDRIVRSSTHSGFKGDLSVDEGGGWQDLSWTEAERGTVVFLTVNASAGTLIMVK